MLTLAQHPERLVVGELRGEESLDVIEGVLRNGDGRALIVFLDETSELHPDYRPSQIGNSTKSTGRATARRPDALDFPDRVFIVAETHRPLAQHGIGMSCDQKFHAVVLDVRNPWEGDS